MTICWYFYLWFVADPLQAGHMVVFTTAPTGLMEGGPASQRRRNNHEEKNIYIFRLFNLGGLEQKSSAL